MTATDLLAAGLGSLRRGGLLLLAAGAVLVLVLAARPSTPDAHHLDGGAALQLATATSAG